MDKKRALTNVSVAIIFKFILLILSILTRRFIIDYIGNDANGLNSLYQSIIGVLSITELGVGSAITFSMYKPIVDNDEEKVSALYNLFVKVYRVIGLIILLLGLCVMPLLPILAKGYESTSNLYLTFALMLISVVLTYAFSAKISLINAYKNNYITTTINSICLIVEQILQSISLVLFKSFEIYLLCRIISTLLHWILINIYTEKDYKNLIHTKNIVDKDTKQEVIKNSKAFFMHSIGGLFVNTADSIIISSFIGVVVLGKYSNYLTIMTGMTSILGLFFAPLSSMAGQLCAKDDEAEKKKYFKYLFFVNFILGIIFYLGYYAIIDDLVSILFGNDLLMSKSVSFVITLDYFIQFMRQATLLFKDATGSFYYDRWKPLIEGIVNIILSITMVYFWGITGVIIATIITNLLICHVVEPYVLYKHGFKESPKKYYINNYFYIGVFIIALLLMSVCMIHNDNVFLELIINGFISVGISSIPVLCIFIFNKEFRDRTNNLIKSFFSKFKRNKQNA